MIFFIYLFIYPSVYLSVYLLIGLSICLRIYLPVYLPTYIPLYLSIYLPTCPHLSFCLSIYIYLFIYYFSFPTLWPISPSHLYFSKGLLRNFKKCIRNTDLWRYTFCNWVICFQGKPYFFSLRKICLYYFFYFQHSTQSFRYLHLYVFFYVKVKLLGAVDVSG